MPCGAPGALILLLISAPVTALAQDLGDALEYIKENAGRSHIQGYEPYAEGSKHEKIAVFNARRVKPGRNPEDYDCRETLIDHPMTFRSSNIESWSDRECRELMWRRDSLKGYKTLGRVRLNARKVRPWIEAASAQTNVAALLIDTIIKYSSGYRPGVISDEGHLGLMQLRPDLLEAMGIQHGDLLDPQENIRVGAIYIQRLYHKYGGIKDALAAYQDGPRPEGAPYGVKRIWFVREVLGIYYNMIRDFPVEFGVEAMEEILSY